MWYIIFTVQFFFICVFAIHIYLQTLKSEEYHQENISRLNRLKSSQKILHANLSDHKVIGIKSIESLNYSIKELGTQVFKLQKIILTLITKSKTD